jgi:hypothetical protein
MPVTYKYEKFNDTIHKNSAYVDSEIFWTWCITLRITGFSNYVHRPVFYILENNVSETIPVSVLRWRETHTLLGPLERANLNHWTDPVSEMLCFLVF